MLRFFVVRPEQGEVNVRRGLLRGCLKSPCEEVDSARW